MESIIASGSDFLCGPLSYDVLNDQASYVTGRRHCQIFASVPEAGPSSVKSVKFNIADPNGFIDLSTLCFSWTVRETGGVAMMGWHSIKTWSTTQTVVAMSSGEAELYSLTKGAAQTLGLIAMAKDLGVTMDGTLHTDASAALGIIAREGLGKLRHVKVQYLWIQDRIRGGISLHRRWPASTTRQTFSPSTSQRRTS